MAKGTKERGDTLVKANEAGYAGHADIQTVRLVDGAIVEGQSAEASISRVVLYQGTAKEEQTYGQHKRGDFVDALECVSLGPTIDIVPVCGFTTWSRFDGESDVPTYSVRDRAQVPPDDLQWREENGQRLPPAAQESVNMVVLVRSAGKWMEWPYLLTFRRTGYRAYDKVIRPMESRRGHGIYQMSSILDKNSANQPYQRLTAKPSGSCPDELRQRIGVIKQQFARADSEFRAKAETHAQEAAKPYIDDGAKVAAADEDIPF